MQYNISLTNDSLTVVFLATSGVRVHTINSTHPSWDAVINLINDPDAGLEIEKLMSVKETIAKFSHGRITVSDNAVFYDGKPVHGFIVDRILEFVKNNLPYQPLVKFLDRVRTNPSARSVEELYKFLEHRKMPLTPNGTFLAYKSVRADYTDHHTGTIRNRVGDSPNRLERNQVDDDANRGCSYGYHVGSLEYAQSFGGGDKHLMIVEVDPADVVSVPYDCNCQKLRCTWYKVIREFERPLNDTLNTDYVSDGDVDDATVEGEIDGGAEEDVFSYGYSNGYDDGIEENGFDNTVDDDIPDEFVDVYEAGYQSGYDDGVSER